MVEAVERLLQWGSASPDVLERARLVMTDDFINDLYGGKEDVHPVRVPLKLSCGEFHDINFQFVGPDVKAWLAEWGIEPVLQTYDLVIGDGGGVRDVVEIAVLEFETRAQAAAFKLRWM